jgi:hypothetical protein
MGLIGKGKKGARIQSGLVFFVMSGAALIVGAHWPVNATDAGCFYGRFSFCVDRDGAKISFA